MKRVAQIKDGKVVNVTVQPDSMECCNVMFVESNEANIGWSYNPETGEFSPPEPSPEELNLSVTRKQFFQQLSVDGTITEGEALTAIVKQGLPQLIEDFSASFDAQLYFLDSSVFKKNDPFVQALNLKDSFWEQASEL